MKGDVKQAVWKAVGKEAIPIHKIAQSTGLSVSTTSKYCHVLEAEKKVTLQKFGNMKLVKRK